MTGKLSLRRTVLPKQPKGTIQLRIKMAGLISMEACPAPARKIVSKPYAIEDEIPITMGRGRRLGYG
jgi:hypothetical protein